MLPDVSPPEFAEKLVKSCTQTLPLRFAERLLVPEAGLPPSLDLPDRWFSGGPAAMSGHVFLDGSWMDQHLPQHAQVAAWALVALQPTFPFRELSVMCGLANHVRVDIDYA
eukprot:7742766-Pyramimonas_sp.AAC.1